MTSVINVGGQRVGVQVIPQPQAASSSAQVGGFLRAASASAPVCIVSIRIQRSGLFLVVRPFTAVVRVSSLSKDSAFQLECLWMKTTRTR